MVLNKKNKNVMSNNKFINRIRLTNSIVCLLLISGLFLHVRAQQRDVPEPVLIDSAFNLYQIGNIYLSGQPDQEEFASLANNGVKLIINIRTAGEMKKFADEEFDEASYVKGLQVDYLNVGVGGPDGYNPEVIDVIANKIKASKGKVLIHCRSAARATMVWMAWLVRTGQSSIDEAINLGKKARYSTSFEDLLGFPVTEKRVK